MDDILDKSPISISVIDYIGKIEDGVGLLLNFVVNETTYEVGYWFNENNVRIIPEDKLLKRLNINNIYDYEYIKELIQLIEYNIPNKRDILNEFI